MRTAITGLLLSAACLTALPAMAQGNRVERTQAEIAYEQAESTYAAKREAREAAASDCAARDYHACVKLGDFHRKGEGGLQDYDLAAKAYDTACKGGNGEGCASLAYLTTLGRGMAADQPKARQLYKLSCDLGEVSGCAGYGNMAYTGTGGTKNVVEGTKLLKDSCSKGYSWACTRLKDLGVYDPSASYSEQMQRLRDR